MNRQLFDLLVCPKSKKKLEVANRQTIDAINAEIKARKCQNIEGTLLETPLDEALFQPGEKLLYPVRDGIPVLIYEQAIDISNL